MQEPVVKLINYFREPYNNAIASARTCYSSNVVYPDDVDKDEKARKQRDKIAESIYKAGHHTVFQHANFQFVLDKVSRQFIWSFLHSHPFYNSEQVSQRYVEVRKDNFFIPPIDEKNKSTYIKTINFQMTAYANLIKLLEPVVTKKYKKIFPDRDLKQKKWSLVLKTKQQEIARYVLPVATYAYLYHTINGITLHRYHRLCNEFDVPFEQKTVVKKMIEEINRIDPLFFKKIEDPLPTEQTLEYEILKNVGQGFNLAKNNNFIKEFDKEIHPYISKLIDYKVNTEETLSDSVRTVLGIPKSELNNLDAIDFVLNPEKNRYFSESLNLTHASKLTKAMVNVHFTFKKKISHTADSQNQRHRMIPAARPIIIRNFSPSTPDYITPFLIQVEPSLQEYYDRVMKEVWENISFLLESGVKEEYVLYLLPNAFTIRLIESGDLLGFHHKWTKRLCYNAQEEILRTSFDEVMQIKEKFPNIAKYILTPCGLRKFAKKTPYCPEGDRFCGVNVWDLKIENLLSSWEHKNL